MVRDVACIRVLMYFCLMHAFKLLILVGSICSCMLVSCVYIVYVIYRYSSMYTPHSPMPLFIPFY